MSSHKQLILLRSHPMRTVPNAISKKQYPRCSCRCWFAAYPTYARKSYAAPAVEEPSRRHTRQCVWKKSYWTSHVCPAIHFPRVSVTKRRMKALSSSRSNPSISPHYPANDEASKNCICKIQRLFYPIISSFRFIVTLIEFRFCNIEYLKDSSFLRRFFWGRGYRVFIHFLKG